MDADFIIIGAGSAGCVVSNRLSEDKNSKILLLENGGSDKSPLIQMPAALSYPMNMKKYDWGFMSDPEPKLNNRRLATPRGNVIGGASSINGMVFVRGNDPVKNWNHGPIDDYYVNKNIIRKRTA